MNKRKVLSILLLALITVSLAVSCSGSIDTPKQEVEELAYVTFGNGHSRELGTSYETARYSSLYWFYTAIKDDKYGTTGQVGLTDNLPTAAVSKSGDNPATGLGGQVGPFSQGKWIFTLYAYAEELNDQGEGTGAPDKSNLIYQSDAVSVILKGNEVKNVPVSVSPQGSTGYVKFNNAFFKWDGNSGGSKPTMEIKLTPATGSAITNTIPLNNKGTDGKLTITNGTKVVSSETVNTIPAGFYTADVIVYLKDDILGIDNKGTPVFSQTFGLRVYGNATTYISGNMVEGVDTKVTFDVAEQQMVVFSPNPDGSASFSVAVSPKGATTGSSTDTKTTQVVFPAGALVGAEHQLDVAVTPIASAEQSFQISGETNNETAVAGIDLTMVKVEEQSGSLTQTPVKTFNGKSVTVTTYIATGLSNVSVRYIKSENDGSGISTGYTIGTREAFESGEADGYYDSSSGMLVFKTTHFSQYVVVASVEALNVNTGIPYATLASAIAAAGDGQEIQLKKDVRVSKTIVIDKGITLDLNEQTIAGDGIRALQFKSGSSTITGSGDVKANIDNAGSSVIRVGDNDATSDVSLTIDKNVIICSDTSYGITVFGNKYETLIVFGTITSSAPENTPYDGCAVSTLGSDTTASTIIIHEGATLSAAHSNGIYMPSGNLVVYGGSITGTTGIYIKSGPSEINGGTITGTGVRKGYQTYGNGGISTGDALVVDNTDYPNGAPSVSVTGGTFISTNANAVGSYAKTVDNTSGAQLPLITGFITGGTFNTDPSIFIADGYYVENSNDSFTVKKHDMWIDYADTNIPIDDDGNYLISTPAQLAGLAKLVNSGEKTFSGETVRIMADIDLSGKWWTPIGQNADSANKFQGTLNGMYDENGVNKSHVIRNMTVSQGASYHAAGFFGALKGIAKYLEFDYASVTSLSAPNTLGNTDNGNAVVAGSIYTSGSIENVTVKNSSVSANRYVGGIAGYAYGSVKNCTVDILTLTVTPDNLHNNTYDNGDKAGGIVGAFWHENTYEISGNTAKNVTITGYRDLGGIVGYANGRVTNNKASYIILKQDYSILTVAKSTVEGIIGRHDGFDVDSSNTSSNVTFQTIGGSTSSI